jgi:beta-glucanase (GH16 family)
MKNITLLIFTLLFCSHTEQLNAQNNLPLNFETGSYDITNFGGGELAVIDNPEQNGINISSKVGQMIKYPGDPWGGSFIMLSTAIDFSTSEEINMKVYSPKTDAAVLLKIEHPTDQGIFEERTLYTSVSNQWEELTFDFSGSASGTYQKVVVIFDNGTVGDGSSDFTFLVDDIELNGVAQNLNLSDLQINGTTVPGFSPFVNNYTYTVEAGTTNVPTVTVSAEDPAAIITITPANQIPGTTTIAVTAADGSSANSYSVIFIEDGAACTSGYTGNTPGMYTYELIWEDDFLIDGPLCSENWYHQTLLPNGSSWYNGEIQHYTDRTDNSFVENGVLKIVAKKETFTDQGVTKQYTSARLNSKMAFRYGRVEIRAKLPSGNGTWPALWSLGKNVSEPGAYWQTQGFGTTSWPYCGEIDMMEHWGSNQDYVQSAIHTPSSYGGTVNHGGQVINSASTEFHVYAMEWTDEKMVFSVDGSVHYTYNPAVKDSDTWPFDAEQYLIFNIAILPEIDPAILETTMEIDYVRIYQRESGQGPTEPLTAAAEPPARNTSDVISIYSDAYANVSGSNYDPDWGQSTEVTYEVINGDNTLKFASFNYQGIEFGSFVDISQFDYLHVDMWTSDESSVQVNCISPGPAEKPYVLNGEAGQWSEFDIPLDFFSDVVDLSQVFQFKFDNGTGGTLFLDNLYFYKEVLSNDATLSNLNIDEQTLPDFDPAVTHYSVVLPPETTSVPHVTVSTSDSAAGVQITPAATLPGTTNIAVTAQDGSTLTYSIYFVLEPCSSATFADWEFSGTNLGFPNVWGGASFTLVPNPDGTGYVGAQTLGQGEDEYAGMQSDQLPGSINLDSCTKITIDVLPSNPGLLIFKLDDSYGFYSSIEVPVSVDSHMVGVWTTLLVDIDSAVKSFPGSGPADPEQISSRMYDQITIVCDAGATHTGIWYIDNIIGPEYDILCEPLIPALSEISINGQPLSDYAPGTFSYDYPIRAGNVTPTVTVEIEPGVCRPNPSAEVSVSRSYVPSSSTISVTSDDGLHSATYIVNFVDIITLPLDFERGTYAVSGINGGEFTYEYENNLTSYANHVGKLVKVPGHAWAGGSITLTEAVDLSNNGYQFQMDVLSPSAGDTIYLRIENPSDSMNFIIAEAYTAMAGQWETLSFDVTASVGLNGNTNDLSKVVLLTNLNSTGDGREQSTYSFDNIQQVNCTVNCSPYPCSDYGINPPETCPPDVNRDGVIGVSDLSEIYGEFENTCE